MKRKITAASLLATSVALSGGVLAQEVVEEILVTGSFIKRNKFEMASPVETITPTTILQSGETSIGGLVRNLPYTQNVDTVANVLGSNDGQQDSNGAQFNLRGLGSTSTLTLFDGRRAIDPDAISSIIPELAIGSVDIVLDGGAATYGTDAVAGVVNFIPLQSYDGFKIRGFYSQDEKGDVPEPKINLLWGKSWENLDIVTALDYSKRDDALLRSDRPKYNRAEYNTSTSGNPGAYRAYQNGYAVGPSTDIGLDPACGTFNGDNTDGGLAGAYPSGYPYGPYCTFEYGEFNDYKRPFENLVLYTGITYTINDNVKLKAIVNYIDRSSTLNQSPSTAGNNRYLYIPAEHPNNPFGVDVEPSSWRPFPGKMSGTNPSALDDRGVYTPFYGYETYQVNLGTEFELGDSGWYGEAWGVYGSRTRTREVNEIDLTRMNLALNGMGGPNGDEWFNPFGSASSLSVTVPGADVPAATGFGDCAPGLDGLGNALTDGSGNRCSNNSQSVVDWVYTPGEIDDQERTYTSFEAFIGGDIFELPAGTVAMAVGVQTRKTEEIYRPSSQSATQPSYDIDGTPFITPSGLSVPNDYNSSPLSGLANANYGENAVNSIFTEFNVPLLDSVEMILAFRYEDFKDFNMSTTVPKISFRWEAMENLAFRTSWGEGFLAPSIANATVDPTPSCSEQSTVNNDVFNKPFDGALVCRNGNPNLDPEESTIFNIGATWKPLDDLTVSFDYQQIKYESRIVRNTTSQTMDNDYQAFIGAGLDPANDADIVSWYSSGMSPYITRDLDPLNTSTYLQILELNNIPVNFNAVEVEVVDFRISYGIDLNDWGYFVTRFSSTMYPSYDYEASAGAGMTSVVGNQNAQINLVPPLPKYKNNLNLTWLLDAQSFTVSVNNAGSVDFDARLNNFEAGPTFGPDAITVSDLPKHISAYTTINVRYGYTFDDVAGGRVDLGIGSTNVTNNRAQALPIFGGLETRLQDPIGRTFYAEATYSFDN